MSKIPTIGPSGRQLSNPKLTTQSPMAEQTQTIGPGKGLEAIGGAVEKGADFAYQKLDQARNYVESSKFDIIQAKGEALKAKYALGTTTDKDGRVWASTGSPEERQALDNELRSLEEESLSVFTSKEQKAKAVGVAGKNAISVRTDVQNAWMKNIAKNGEAATSIFYDGLIEDTTLSLDVKKKLFNDRANSDIANHIATPEVAYNREQIAFKKAKNALAISDLNNNPALFKENLDKNTYQFDITEKESMTKLYDREIGKIKDDNENAIIAAELNGKPLDKVAILDLMNKGKVDIKWAEEKIKNLNKIENVSTNPAVYEDIKNMITGGAKSIDIKRAIEGARNVSLSNSDADTLYYIKQEGKDSSVYQAYYKDTHTQDSYWAAALNSLQDFAIKSYGVASTVFPLLVNRFISVSKASGVSKEQLPTLALNVVKSKILEDNPSISNLKDIPNAKFDKDGYKPLLEGKNDAEPNYIFRGGKLVSNKKE